MSWVAHDLEPYVFQRKIGGRTIAISFVALTIGSWGPDMMTKWFVYGTNVVGVHLRASDPVQFHRGWPGAGFTHSLTFAVLVGTVAYVLTRSRAWAVGLFIGMSLHTLTDIGDTVGCMLFFPWTRHFHVGAWAYAGQTGRFTDAAAYYSGLGFVWDSLWVVLALAAWPILRSSYFHEHIAPRDGFWSWAGRRLPDEAVLAVYRGAIFFGLCRYSGWMIWAHVRHHYAFDPTWGGPHWVDAAHPH